MSSFYEQAREKLAKDKITGSKASAMAPAVKEALLNFAEQDEEFAQAERIAWRNVKDWIAAQLAMVETEQATMQELFLPYLIDGTQTLHERVLTSGAIPELPKGEV